MQSPHPKPPTDPGQVDVRADVRADARADAGAVAAPAAPAGEAMTHLQLAAEPPGEWIGRVLDDRYRITERLGEGGMGAVFVAEHLKLHKAVALKVIRAELAGNGEVAARFAREAMATAQFEHPHVASAIDYGTLPEGGAYLVMQLVRGRALREVLDARGRLPWPKACELMAQVADALSAARGAGIVHRDLKPENMLVETREDGTELVKILDFGIAHVSPRLSPAPEGAMPTRELTRVGVVMGTPGYMSPEQAVGDKVDHRTDLYALGVVLWECIAGHSLWDGPDVTTIITRQLQNSVPRLRETAADPTLPRELDDLVQSLCAKAADARPEHAGQVRDTLRALVHRHSAQSGTFAQVTGQAVHSAVLRARALSDKSRVLIALGAVAALLAAAAFGFGSRSPTASGASADAAARQADETPSLPPELEAEVKALLEAAKVAERRRAAQALLAHEKADQLEKYVLAIARLENARGCKDRKDTLREIAELADARTLETLRRFAGASKTGCGFLDLEDCYGCIRGDLRRTIEAIEAKGAPPSAP